MAPKRWLSLSNVGTKGRLHAHLHRGKEMFDKVLYEYKIRLVGCDHKGANKGKGYWETDKFTFMCEAHILYSFSP